jgi:glycosyltransferase involved in cell wall biosynthesis
LSKSSVLYITYDGLMEPLGQSQVLPYLRGLAGEYAITILSFEKPKDLVNGQGFKAVREQLSNAGIEWIPLRYHKRPSVPATAFDIVHGIARGLVLSLQKHTTVVHARGYVAGVIGIILKTMLGTKLIFDMRGFWPDEKVDAGAWSRDSLVYRASKRVEKSLLQRADVVVSLTQAGVTEMEKFPYLRTRETRYEVIPTCADLRLFQPASRRSEFEQRDFVLGYAGSVGTFYLFDEVLECYKELRKVVPKACLMIVNRDGHSYIRERLKARCVPMDRITLHAAEYQEVPEYLRQMDAAAFFIKPTFSKKGSSPTRLGEFLGCGVPCLVNGGVGDMEEIVESERVGVVVQGFSPQDRADGIRKLLALCAEKKIRTRCTEAARSYFSLEIGLAAYRKIHRGLGTRTCEPKLRRSTDQVSGSGPYKDYP